MMMSDFKQTSSLSRHLSGLTFLAVMLLIVGFLVNYFFSMRFLDGFVTIYHTESDLRRIGSIRENLRSNEKTLEAALLPGSDVEALGRLVDTRQKINSELLETLNSQFKDDSQMMRFFAAIKESQERVREFDAQFFATLQGGLAQKSQVNQTQTFQLAAKQFREEMLESLAQFSAELRLRQDQNFVRLDGEKNKPLYAAFVFTIIAGILFYAVARRFSRRINRSLHNLELAADLVGQGNLDVKAHVLYGDEIGKLTHDFNRMTENLKTLTVSKTKLEEKNHDLEQFSYIASHDLQEPLRKIIAYGDVLVEDHSDKLDQDGVNSIAIIQNAAIRMRELIDSLLAYSRVGRSAETFSAVDLNELLKVICNDLEIAIRESNAQIEYDALPVIFGDRVQIRQLFQNLLSNSIKFVPKHKVPHIKIESRLLSHKLAEIRVVDNGIGFENQYIERIFLPFRRLHTREEYKGTGIGLAICKKIVECHGGHITAESQVGRGAQFILELPCQSFNYERGVL